MCWFHLGIPFWITLTLTLTSGPFSRFFLSGAYLLYYSLLSSNVSYARPIPLGAFVTWLWHFLFCFWKTMCVLGHQHFSFISGSSVVHGSHTKNDIPIHLDQVLKWQKILVSNIFYHFLFAVSLGNKASKNSEKFRLDRKIGFQNMFHTKCIVIIDSIGPSFILRSICLLYTFFWRYSDFIICFGL